MVGEPNMDGGCRCNSSQRTAYSLQPHLRSIVLKKYLSAYAFLFSIAGAIVLLDQLSKFLVRTRLPFGEVWSPFPWLMPFARIVHWENTGAAFGLFQKGGPVFAVLAIIVAAAILYYFPQVPKEDWAMRIALALQFGGALGNLIDRLRHGPVTDFISVGNFAVFNVADASITVGVVILLFSMWFKERKKPASPAGELPPEPPKDQPNPPRSEGVQGE
jgi:signal peptidase II